MTGLLYLIRGLVTLLSPFVLRYIRDVDILCMSLASISVAMCRAVKYKTRQN